MTGTAVRAPGWSRGHLSQSIITPDNSSLAEIGRNDMADINTIIQTSIKMLMANPCQTKIEVSSLHNDVGSGTWDLGIGHAYWDISLVRSSPRENKDGC